VLQWKVSTGGPVYASPSVVNGTVYIPSYDGTLYAIDEYSGTLKWTFPTGAGIVASPAVGYGRVFVASRDARLYAIDAQTGTVIWAFANISPLTSSPVVADGKVFYGTWLVGAQSYLYALNATAPIATPLWRFSSGDTIRNPPSVLNGRVFFAEQGIVFALNETSGSLLWTTGAGTNTITAAPALSNGNVYVGTDHTGGTSGFYAFDQVSGALKWSYSTGTFNATSGAIANGIAYFGTGGGTLFALNATTGVRLWQYPPTGVIGGISSSPAVALGSKTLVFGSSDHYMYALNLTSHVLLWRYLTGSVISSSPAVADYRIFFGGWEGNIYSLGSNPQLYVTVTSNPASLRPGQVSTLRITVTNGTVFQTNVNLTISQSVNANITSPVAVGPGNYAINFTAPVVTSTVPDVIQVTASKSGYLSGSGQTTITLNTYPNLIVGVSPVSRTVSLGADTVVKITVGNGTQGIAGAAVILSSSAGGSFSGLTDEGNGNYVAVYTAPLIATSIVITAQAEKTGFTAGQGNAALSVSSVPDPISTKILGAPLLVIIGIIVGLFVLILLFIAALRKKNYVPYHLRNSPPAYVLDSSRQGFI
jgi:outer membrane protein assembly factor BamB